MADPIVPPVAPVTPPATPPVVPPVVPPVEPPPVVPPVTPPAEPKTASEFHDAAIQATEAWQANPTPETKAAAQAAVDKAKTAAKAPESYTITLPEKSILPAEHIEKVAAFAKEQGLSNDAAQAILNRDNQLIADRQAAQEAAVTTMQAGWLTTASKDPEIGGAEFNKNAELAKRVLARFGTPEFNKVLADPKQGLFGNHPDLVRVMVRIGKAMSDDQLVVPGAQGDTRTQSVADKLYGAKQ